MHDPEGLTPASASPPSSSVGKLESPFELVAPASSAPSVKELARAWSSASRKTESSMSDRTAPPTLEELEAMERKSAWEDGCPSPSASEPEIAASSTRIDEPAGASTAAPSTVTAVLSTAGSPPAALRLPYSRQVSRVSGTGRAALQHAPLSRESPARPAQGALAQDNGSRSRAASKFRDRRSTSVDDMDHRLKQRVRKLPAGARAVTNATDTTGPTSAHHRGQSTEEIVPAAAVSKGDSVMQNVSSKNKTNINNTRTRGHAIREVHVPKRRTPQAAHVTPSASQQKIKHHPEVHQKDGTAAGGGAPKPAAEGTGESRRAIRRRNSAPEFGELFGKVIASDDAETSPQGHSSGASPLCWGGGLPPKRGVIAQGPAVARAAAARAQPQADRFEKYPANDRGSFARTLNEDELDEVWKGLGEGVSQRGGGSEVAFEAPPEPSSPKTAVSGAFPMLTANMLERHDQLGVDGMNKNRTRRTPNVMPMPKDLGGKTAHEMENGTRSSSKKSNGSMPKQPTLLVALISYVVLVLWISHLVFNIYHL